MNVRLPDALKRKREKLEAAMEPPTAEDTPPAQATPPSEPEPAAEPSVPDDVQLQSADLWGELDDTPAPEPASAPAPEPAPAPVDLAPIIARLDAMEETVSGFGAQALPTIDTQLSADEQTRFGESTTFVQKIATAVVASMADDLVAPLTREIEDIRQSIASLGQATNQVRETSKTQQRREFERVLTEKDPKIAVALKDPKFQEFLATRAPYTDATFGVLYKEALAKLRPQALLDIVSAFRTRQTNGADVLRVNQPTPSHDPLQKAAGLQVPAGDDTVRYSDREKLWADYRAGRITQQDYHDGKVKFEKAVAEERVVYDN